MLKRRVFTREFKVEGDAPGLARTLGRMGK